MFLQQQQQQQQQKQKPYTFKLCLHSILFLLLVTFSIFLLLHQYLHHFHLNSMLLPALILYYLHSYFSLLFLYYFQDLQLISLLSIPFFLSISKLVYVFYCPDESSNSNLHGYLSHKYCRHNFSIL